MDQFTLFMGKVMESVDDDDMKEHSQILAWVKIHSVLSELNQCSLPVRKR